MKLQHILFYQSPLRQTTSKVLLKWKTSFFAFQSAKSHTSFRALIAGASLHHPIFHDGLQEFALLVLSQGGYPTTSTGPLAKYNRLPVHAEVTWKPCQVTSCPSLSNTCDSKN